MSKSSTEMVKEQITEIHCDTVSIFEKLFEKTIHLDLPKLPGAVEQFKQKLASNTYNVLVVGEAKRGKSSFVNALIGRKILPTDVDIATNQVFRVKNASQEAYQLSFDDGTSQSITLEELQEYGSQTVADQKQIVHLNLERLDYIEVELPVRFLPAGVSLFDTPGMGSLYAAHALVTRRFVPQADAVIYVLDSSQPVIRSELDFIASILEVTNDVFIVQTKIDMYDQADWRRVQQRNEEILRERFRERLQNIQVWPISSENLLKAAARNSQPLLKVSRQKELLDALEVFLFKIAGWNRCAAGLQVAERCYTSTKQVLSREEAMLRESSKQDTASLQRELLQKNQRLEAQWATGGTKQQEMMKSVKNVTRNGKLRMMQFLDVRGPLETHWRRAIDGIQSLEGADELGRSLFGNVTTEATSTWQEICEQARNQCANLVGVMVEEVDILYLSRSAEMTRYEETKPDIEEDIADKLDKAQTGFLLGGALGFVLISAIPFLLPFAPIAIGAGGILGAINFWKRSEDEQMEKAMTTLHTYLGGIMQDVRSRFLQPRPDYDGQSLVSSYFEQLTQTMEGQIEEFVTGKLEEVRREREQLEERARLDEEQRQTKAQVLQQQVEEWEEVGRAIKTVTDTMKRLEPSFKSLFGTSQEITK